jgi:hypothetical protein
MRVVISGVASRYELGLDELDDVQLAVESLLAEEPRRGGMLELRVWNADDGFHVRICGLTNQEVKKVFVTPGSAEPCKSHLLGMRLFLPSLVDCCRVVAEEADSFGIEMEKRTS